MPKTNLWEFQHLVIDLRDEGSAGWGGEELVPWLEQRPAIVSELHAVGRPENHRNPAGPDDNLLTGLYALGRLVDVLISPHQPVNDDPALLNWTNGKPWWTGPEPSGTAWDSFRRAIGATTIAEDDFHPFFHEIVTVQPADDPDEAPSLAGEHWPGALIGGMLLARAGVTVRAGPKRMDPVVAARSCLYWAWWRRNRVVRDLSHGWGAVSQWRTDFRRDYVVGDELHYNIDSAKVRLANPADQDSDLSPADRLDLLRFRHSLRRDLGDDRWPYYDSLAERRP